MIADFSGMLPLRDALLLPDNNARFARNCWLYRGQVRGFRKGPSVHQLAYADTKQVFRIPLTDANPPLFTDTDSLWLEFPDPYMTTIRNPTVGDTFDRYYFFPSDEYSSSASNPSWPAASPGPVYNTLARLQSGSPNYILGVKAPTLPVTVTPPTTSVIMATTAITPVGGTVLTFGSSPVTAGVLAGMNVLDLTDHRLSAATTLASAVGTTLLNFSSTGTAPNNIAVGMTVKCTSNPAVVFTGTTVAAVTPTTVTLSINLVGAVVAGDTFQFDNANQITSGTTAASIGGTTVALSAPVKSAGVQVGDTIQFISALPETRAYVYTYVTDFSEESQPSPATVASGDGTGTWTVVIPQPPAGYNTNMPMAPGHFRLYRTVVDSTGNATYYQVTEVPINPSGTTTIHDGALDASITANLQLSTIGYAPPPAGLQGVVMMANGIAAGFTNSREVWFSAAYLPHAWPPQYALTVDYPIVGLTANGSSLNIICQGSPFIATGVTPDTMTIGKITANEPCIGRGSIVAAGEGAYYASPNGIQLLNTGGTQNITQQIYEKEFNYLLQPNNWASAKYGLSYVSFFKGLGITSPDDPDDFIQGFTLDNTDTNVPFSYLQTNAPVLNVYMDELSGQIFRIDGPSSGVPNGQVMQWNPPIMGPELTPLRSWEWWTKDFRFTSPQGFKAFMVLFDVPVEVPITPGVRNTSQTQVFDPTKQYMIIRVFADNKLVVIREIQTSGEVLLIPGDSKAEIWQFQFEGQISMRFFKVASSVKELKAA
jgi:hypothetical protein